MAITVKHTKVSTIPDDADTSLVRPSDWNADHTLVGLGTMAEQNANAVAITGGTATLSSVTTPIVQATNSAGLALRNSGGTTQISMGAGGGDNVTVAVSTNLNGANAQIDISPTGTGHVHIKPTGVNSVEIIPVSVGKMDNVAIGATTPSTGSFTKELINQSYDQGTGVLQVTGNVTNNGTVVDKSLVLQGGNNLHPYSQLFSNGVWTLTGATLPSSTITAPDGTSTAFTLQATNTTNYHFVGSTSAYGVAGTYTASAYVKAGTNNFVSLQISNGGNFAIATFNLASPTAATKTQGFGNFTFISSSIASTPNGYYRISVTGSTTGAGAGVGISHSSSATPTYSVFGVENWTAAGTETFQIWGAQLELGTVASAYTPTTTVAITTTNNISVPSGQVFGNKGLSSAPSYSFVNSSNTGMFYDGSNLIYTVGGTDRGFFNGNGFNINQANNWINLPSTGLFTWNNGDLSLFRDAANTLAQRNSTNAQTFRLYNTYTDASNYERLGVNWATNVATIQTENLGTGTARALRILAGSGQALSLGNADRATLQIGFAVVQPSVDSAVDLGASGNKFQNAFFSGVVTTNSNASINSVTVGRGGGNVSTNTAVGEAAIGASATGTNNAAFGRGGLNVSTTGRENSSFGGGFVLGGNTTGNFNSAFGAGAMQNNISGSANTALGWNALILNTTGNSNCAVGTSTLLNNTTVSNLTAIGTSALQNNTTNVATLGTITGGTGYTNGTYTGVVMTLSSGSTATTYPTATIVVAGGAVTTVTITSAGVGFKDTTTVLTAPAASIGGTGSGFSVPVATLKSGTLNTAVGYQAGFTNNTGTNNTFNGHSAGYNNTTGSFNHAYGWASLFTNTTGFYNSAYGSQSLTSLTTANFNCAFGVSTLFAVTTGDSNIGIGWNAGNTGTNNLTTGSSNILIGTSTSVAGSANTNSIVLGTSAVGLGSNTTVIGNSSTTRTKVFGTVETTGYTVATLPAAGTAGRRAFVTDATLPTYLGALVGGGAITCPVFDNGVAWVSA
jgi:hypothetical protein